MDHKEPIEALLVFLISNLLLTGNLRLRTIPTPEDAADKDALEVDDSETIVVQTTSIQENAEHVNLTINHNPATVETEAEAVLSDKAKETAIENEKEETALHGETETVETLLETARKFQIFMTGTF